MATRMKMLKLLQEVHGFNHFGSEHPHARPPSALMLPMRPYRAPKPKIKKYVQIRILDPLDIPAPVDIVFLDRATAS